MIIQLFLCRDPVTPPSTPQRHRDRLRRQEQDSRVMHTPQHRRLPAQPPNADPILPAQPSNDDPFVADAPVAGGTWQLPQADVDPLRDVA
jgi:hypothetical protein